MPIAPKDTYAAIDLGSNSFHLLVATFKSGQIHPIDKVKHMVRLAAGLDHQKQISQEHLSRAYASLESLAGRIRNIPNQNIRIVGTNTLRVARNAREFLTNAEKILGHEIEIISGREEARMLYLGVAQSTSEDIRDKLVMDIGGGSTELISGEGLIPKSRESLHMGCVSYTQKHFPNGQINRKNWDQAVLHAKQELNPFAQVFHHNPDQHAIGASGTMRATAKILSTMGLCETGIDREGLKQLQAHCLQYINTQSLSDIPGLSEQRRPVFIGGLSIVSALMDTLQIDHMTVSPGALREGLIYEMSGSHQTPAVKQRSVQKLSQQFDVDSAHVEQILRHCDNIISHLDTPPAQVDALHAAVRLHEIGLSIAHTQYHKIGAFILQNADMPGFSKQQLQFIGTLVRFHRRKIFPAVLAELTTKQQQDLIPLLVILRLAVIFGRNRHFEPVPIKQFEWHEQHYQLSIKPDWLTSHPLIQADLDDEINRLKHIDITLSLNA